MGFTIKELESLSGIKAHTIRMWEQRYHFLKPSRTSTNIRIYSNDELKEILTVALLNKYGYKISKIDNMPPDQRRRAALSLPHEEAQHEQRANDLIGYMIDLNAAAFEQALNAYIHKRGIEDTVTSVIFHFLEKVGILWQTSHISPVHEHVVSNIIRQKIIAAIEDLPLPTSAGPLHLLFLPENEHHELGLLFVYYLLKQKQVPALYLGASVPLTDVHYVAGIKKPSHLYLHLTSFPLRQNFQRYVDALSGGVTAQVVVSGSVTDHYKKPLPPNVVFLKSLRRVLAYISGLR